VVAEMPLTNYTTIYTTVQDIVTRQVVSRYRIVSDIVTRLDVDYYDENTGVFATRISYPTRYLRAVNTLLVSVETRTTGTTPPPGREKTPSRVVTILPTVV
jgi:hypothetical protein